MSEARETAAARLLAEHGLDAVGVRARGFRGEIAALSAGAVSLPRLRALVPELKRLGFRYVALELDPADAGSDS